MFLPKFQFVQPNTVEEACSFLDANGDKAAILAGGTDLMVGLRRRLKKPEYVVGLKRLRDLDYVRKDDAGNLRIGALTTLERIESSPLIIEGYPALAQAAELAAVPPIRRAATIAGNLALDTRCIYYNQSEFWRKARQSCHKLGGDVCHAIPNARTCLAVYQGDLGPILLAMDAKVSIVSAKMQRTIPLKEFFSGRGEKPNVLQENELLAEVIVPNGGRMAGAYEKLRIREGIDFPLAGAAVALRFGGDGNVSQARVVLGAVAPEPVEVGEAANLLVGNVVNDDLLGRLADLAYEKAHPAPNLAIDMRYRRAMIRVLTKRAVRQALQVACG